MIEKEQRQVIAKIGPYGIERIGPEAPPGVSQPVARAKLRETLTAFPDLPLVEACTFTGGNGYAIGLGYGDNVIDPATMKRVKEFAAPVEVIFNRWISPPM